MKIVINQNIRHDNQNFIKGQIVDVDDNFPQEFIKRVISKGANKSAKFEKAEVILERARKDEKVKDKQIPKK